jgi:crotonobetainyl-CoA:carnitine CoA-transferase CaiB-like acyl-CoA transferase
MAAWPVKMSATEVPVSPSPLLGEHNTSVYAEWIGLSADEVASLKDGGAV